MDTFVGRKCEIQKLGDKIKQYNIVVIDGLKGVGKTSLAKEFCKHIEQPYVWIDLRKIHNGDGVIQSLVRHFLQEAVIMDDPRAVLLVVCENIMRQTHNLLVVLDNAEDVLINNDNLFVEILLSLSQLKNTKILVTSTIKVSSENVHFDELSLKELSFEDSFDLLKSICPSLKDTDKISKVVELCEGLPLALLLAGGEVEDNSNSLDVDDVIYLLSHHRLRMLSSECFSQDEQIESIYKGCLDRLPRILEEKLRVVSYIPGTFNLEEAFNLLGTGEEESKVTVQTFLHRHLIARVTEDRFDIHGILRDCMMEYKKIKDIKGVRARFCKIFSDILKKIEKKTHTKDYTDALCQLNVEHQNFMKLFTDVIYCTEDTYHVFVDLAATVIADGSFMFSTMATYSIGVDFYEKCLKKAKEFRQGLDEAKILTGYGKALTNIKGDYLQAEEKFQIAMKIRRGYPEKRDYFLALLCQSYGWNLGSQGKFMDAIRFLQEAFEVERELRMHYENLILQTMQSLALFYNKSGNVDKGEPFQLEVLKRRLYVVGTENHPIIGSSMNNVGVMYEKKGDFDKAIEYYRKGLSIKEETNAPLKAIVISETNLAQRLLETGQNEEAFDLLEKSFKRLTDFPHLFSDAKSLLWESMGKAFLKIHKFDEASGALKKAIGFRFQSSVNDPSILELICLYAESLLALGKHERAIKEIQEGLRLRDIIIKNIPTYPFIVFAYEKLMEAQFALKKQEGLKETYNAGIEEFLRLIKLYEDLRNFNKREDVLTHLRMFKSRYSEMIKYFQCNHVIDHVENETFDILKSFLGSRMFCFILVYFLHEK